MSRIEVNQLPSGWTYTKIDSVVERESGRVDPQEHPDLPYLGLKHIEEASMSLNGQAKGIDYKSSSVHFQSGDVLYARLRPYLNKVYPADFEGLGSGEIIVLSPKQVITQQYLARILNSNEFVNFADKISTGDRPRVKYDQIKEFEFPLPDVDEQTDIIRKLDETTSKIDSGVSDLIAAKKRGGNYKKSVQHAAIEGRLTDEWRNKSESEENGHDLLERTKELREEECGGKYSKLVEPEDIPKYIQIPDEWVWTSLSKVGLISRGKSTHRPRNDPELFGGEYPFIQTGDVRNADIVLKTYDQTYNEKGLAQSKLWPEETLCITIAANIADTAVLGMEACFPDSVVGFQTNPEYCNVYYVDIYMKTIQSDLEQYAPATAQKNINLGTLTTLPVPLPPVEEQNQIVDEVHRRLSITDSMIETAETEIERAENLRQSIMKSAFKGEFTNALKNSESESRNMINKDVDGETEQKTLHEITSGSDAK